MELEHAERISIQEWLEEQGVSHFSDNRDVLEFHGQKYYPDNTRGYVQMKFSHAFPVVSQYGQALMPSVIARSYQSLVDQNFNFEHTLVAYNPDKNRSDRIIGSVKAVYFPQVPTHGWKVTADKSKAPGIEAVASFSKLAAGMDRVIGKHQTGRHKYSVSMECSYPWDTCGFAVALNGKKAEHATPADLLELGYEYVPWLTAKKDIPDLFSKFSMKSNRITGEFNGRRVVMLLGGLDGTVHYDGVAIVKYGAETEAEIGRMVASADDPNAKILMPILKLGPLVKQLRESKKS